MPWVAVGDGSVCPCRCRLCCGGGLLLLSSLAWFTVVSHRTHPTPFLFGSGSRRTTGDRSELSGSLGRWRSSGSLGSIPLPSASSSSSSLSGVFADGFESSLAGARDSLTRVWADEDAHLDAGGGSRYVASDTDSDACEDDDGGGGGGGDDGSPLRVADL